VDGIRARTLARASVEVGRAEPHNGLSD